MADQTQDPNPNPNPNPNTPAPKLADLMKDPDLMKELTSFTDSQVSKAVEAFKQKSLPATIEKEVEARLKAREQKSPEQIRFEEYEAKLAEMQNKIADKERNEMRLANKEKARAKFAEAKLPDTFVDFIVSEDAEKTEANIALALKALESYKTELTQSLLKGSNAGPGGRPAKPGETTLQEPGPNASQAEWTEYWKKLKTKTK